MTLMEASRRYHLIKTIVNADEPDLAKIWHAADLIEQRGDFDDPWLAKLNLIEQVVRGAIDAKKLWGVIDD